MTTEVKKVFLLFIGLFVLIAVVFLGKDFGGNLRNLFLSPKFAEKISPLENKIYRAEVTEDGVLKSIWIQKPPFWRLEIPSEASVVISKNEGNKIYLIDKKYNNTQVQDNAKLDQYTSFSPLGIIKTYQSGLWQSKSNTEWEATLKDSSKVKASFDITNQLLTKLVIYKSNNQIFKTYTFEYNNINDINDNEFEAFIESRLVPSPTPSSTIKTITIPLTGANENMLFALVVVGIIGLILKRALR